MPPFKKQKTKEHDSDSSQKKQKLKTTKSKKSKLTSKVQTKQKTKSRDSRQQTSILNYTGTKGRDSENNNKQDNESIQNSKSASLDKYKRADKKRKSDTLGDEDMSNGKIKRKSALQRNVQYSPEESLLKKKTFFNHQIQSWKPLSTETLDFVQTVLDNGINEILNKNLNLDYDDVKKKLKGLKVRLMTKLKKLNGPKNKYGDYKKLLYSKKLLQSERSKYGEQEDNLQEVVDAAEREQTILEEENKKLERLLDKSDRIHPLLQQKYTAQLDIPDLY